MYGVNSLNQIYARPVDGSGAWRRISGEAKQITASGVYDVFAVDVGDYVYSCRKPCVGGWIQLDRRSQLAQCDATANALFGVSAIDNIYRWDFPL